jgi:hypothetical protein
MSKEMIKTDYRIRPSDYEIWVDASRKYSWWEKLRFWLKGEPVPVGPVTIILPKSQGSLRTYLIRKIDSSDNPVTLKIPKGDGDSYGTYELALAQAKAMLMDCSIGKNKSCWEFAE